MPPFGSTSGAEQASFLSVKVVPPLWKKAVEATNTYIMWVQIQDKVIVFSSLSMNENLRRRGRCEVPFSHTSGRNGHPGCSQNSTLAYTELATGTSSNTGNVSSRPLHYLMFWVFWTPRHWDISPTVFSREKLLLDLVSDYCKVSAILHGPRVTLSGLPEGSSNFQPPGSILIHGCNTLHWQGSISHTFCCCCFFFIKNQSDPQWQISGHITTSVGPLYLSELLLLMEPLVSGKLSVTLDTTWQLPVSWWGPFILCGDPCCVVK